MSKSTSLMAINWLGGSLSRSGISNQESRIFLTGFHVSGKTPAFQLATLHIAKETLFIDLTLCKKGNWKRMALSQWQWSLLDDMNVCSLFGTGDYCELDCCTNAPSIGKTDKTLNSGKCLCFQHGKSCSMLCSISLRTEWGNVIPGSDWICGNNHTAALTTENLLDTTFHESGKLQLFQLSTLRRRHSSLIWPIAKMETVERMALSQWSLLDTCMCALCLVLVIDVNWIAARMPIELARLARYWTRASFCSSSMAKVVWCSAHSRTGKGNVIPGSW